MKEGSLEHKKAVCKDMHSAVRKVKLDDLKATVEKHGLRVQQVWRAPKGEGFKCCAARFIVEGEEVLVVAFRSTFGGDEWLEYSDKYFKRRLLPHDGEEPETDRKVLTIWNETLDEVWKTPGQQMDGCTDTLREMLWRQLNAGNRVWLTGHSKGGAVATTAAARLLLGDSTLDADLPDPATRRPEESMVAVAGGPLSKLSVFTFNAPKAFTIPLAEVYEARLEEAKGEHMRFEHKADRIRQLPPDARMTHVGKRQLEGAGVAEDPGVLAGSAVAIGGVLAAVFAAALKISNSH